MTNDQAPMTNAHSPASLVIGAWSLVILRSSAALAACAARLYDARRELPSRPVRAKSVPSGRFPFAPCLGSGHPAGESLDPSLLLELLAPVLAQEDAGGGGLTSSVWFQLWPFLIIGVLFYFMLIAPERRKRKEMESLLANIKKNDQVVTIGGICGTVVN